MTTPDHVNREGARKVMKSLRQVWNEEVQRGVLPQDRELLNKLP